MKSAPIGIFDSGIGGLTVANAIRKILPEEEIIYFGDTAHMPYGAKSAESIRHYSTRISGFLDSLGCKAIVIACNSASATAHKTVQKHLKNKLVINVIDPVAAYTAKHHSETKVGVIGTKATIGSRVYVKRIRKLDPSLAVKSLATPLLAPMIEEGFFNNNISQTIINSYLSKTHFKGIEALILACTHYPLIQPEVEEYYKNTVEIINSADIVADHLKKQLKARKLLRKGKVKHTFYVSDYTSSFEKSTRLFFGDEIHLEEMRLFE